MIFVSIHTVTSIVTLAAVTVRPSALLSRGFESLDSGTWGPIGVSPVTAMLWIGNLDFADASVSTCLSVPREPGAKLRLA